MIANDFSDLSEALKLRSAMREATNYKEMGAVPEKHVSPGMHSSKSLNLAQAEGPLEPIGEVGSSTNPAPNDFLTRKFSNFIHGASKPYQSDGLKFAALTKHEWTDILLKFYLAALILGLVFLIFLALKG